MNVDATALTSRKKIINGERLNVKEVPVFPGLTLPVPPEKTKSFVVNVHLNIC